MTICFHCGKEILVGDKRTQLGLDVPYINLYFHAPSCLVFSDQDSINAYLVLNQEKLYNWIEQSDKTRRK